MFVISHEELREAPLLGRTYLCPRCYANHPVQYGVERLPDGTTRETKKLAFVVCQGQTYLCGIDGKEIR